MRILLADHHNFYREAVATTVQQAFCEATVHQIAASNALLKSLQNGNAAYDLVVVALEMPGLLLHDLGQLIQQCRRVPVILITGVVRPSVLRSVILYRAAGIVPRTASIDYLVQALRFVLAGGFSIPRDVLFGADPQILSLRDNEADWLPRLTPREQDVLRGPTVLTPHATPGKGLTSSNGLCVKAQGGGFGVLPQPPRAAAFILAAGCLRQVRSDLARKGPDIRQEEFAVLHADGRIT